MKTTDSRPALICPICDKPMERGDPRLIAVSYDERSGGWAHHEADVRCQPDRTSGEQK